MCSLVGNKNDSPDKKVVQLEEAQKYADQVKIDLFETSAKDNINVEEVMFCVLFARACVPAHSVYMHTVHACVRVYVCVCICVVCAHM